MYYFEHRDQYIWIHFVKLTASHLKSAGNIKLKCIKLKCIFSITT